MDLSNKLLALLAIFCIIVSASAVCAADVDYDGGYAGSQYQDDGGWAGSQYQDDGGWAGSQYDPDSQGVYDENSTEGLTDRPLIDPDYAHMEHAAGEPVNQTGNATGNITNQTVQAAGEPVSNTTANATASHTMPATGNPIVLLLGVGAILGGYTVLRRKN